jgi:polyisoprenoid-binding protein YceI
MLEGRLTLHGVEKPINLQIRLITRGRELRAEGEVSLLQSDFGISPIRVGGGTVKVKDNIRIRFDVVADAVKL